MGIYVMATEFVGRRHRHVAGTSLWYSWTLALVFLAGLAYGVRDWRILSIICAALGLPIIIAWRYEPFLGSRTTGQSFFYLCTLSKIVYSCQKVRKILNQTACKKVLSFSFLGCRIGAIFSRFFWTNTKRTKSARHGRWENRVSRSTSALCSPEKREKNAPVLEATFFPGSLSTRSQYLWSMMAQLDSQE